MTDEKNSLIKICEFDCVKFLATNFIILKEEKCVF